MRCFKCMEDIGDGLICPHCGYDKLSENDNNQYLTPGIIIGNYTIGKVIGAGGFGVTYVGWDSSLQRKVAIKEYFPSNLSTRTPGQTSITAFSGEKQMIFNHGKERFIEEAKLLMQFSGEEGIVSVYDMIEANETVYMVMEYIEGITLKESIDQFGPISEKHLLDCIIPVLLSLKFVHNIGVIHRDISPDNIMCLPDGSVKLIDFGSARYSVMDASKSLSVIVKQGYTPIEQYQSHGNQSEYTDIYAIAATMYKALTGITPEESLERMVNDTLKKPSQCGISVSEQTENAILAAMNVRPEDRPQTIDDFLAILLGEANAIVVTNKKSKKPLIALLASATILLAGITGVIIGILKNPNFGASAEIVVPNIIKKSAESAEYILHQNQLNMTVTGSRLYDEKLVKDGVVEENYIVEQNPVSGKEAKKDSNVDVIISKGKKKQYLPDVSDMMEEGAKSYFEQLGFGENFKIQIKKEHSDTNMAGTVIDQSLPEDTAVDFDGRITLTISLGRENLPEEIRKMNLDDYTGKNFNSVKSQLSKSGIYVVKTASIYSSEYPYGTIISQYPEKGTEVHSGDAVYVVSSLGVEMTRVPDVVYMPLEEAKQALTEAGLSWSIEYKVIEGVQTGLVAEQYLEGGIKTLFGTEIKLTVSADEAKTEKITKVDFKIDPPSTNVNIGESIILKASYEGTETIHWSSSNPNIASVDEKGNVKGIKFGTVTVTASVGGNIKTAIVTVVDDSIFSNIKDYSIAVGDKVSLATSIPESIRSKVTWRSSFPEVAEVDSDGNVTAKKEGYTSITAAYENQIAECGISVIKSTKYVKVLRQLMHGKYETAKQTLDQKGVKNETQYEYSNTIPEGMVTEIRYDGYVDNDSYYFIEGTKVIIKCSQGKEVETQKPVEKNKVSSVNISPSSVTLTIGVSQKLNVTISPANAEDKSLIWTTTDPSVVTVDSSGTIKAIKKGTAIVKAKSSNGKESSCSVTVNGLETSLKIKSNPTKTTYYIGDGIDKTGMVLEYKDENGKTTEVKDGFTVSCNTSTAGTKTATVTYKELSKTFTVTVKTPTIKVAKYNTAQGLVLLVDTEPENQPIVWSSSNEEIFYFKPDTATIVAVSEGYANAYATMVYNGIAYSDYCRIGVEAVKKYSFEIIELDTTCNDGEMYSIETDIPDFKPQNVKWSTTASESRVYDDGDYYVYSDKSYSVTATYTHEGKQYSDTINVTVQVKNYHFNLFKVDGEQDGYSFDIDTNIPNFDMYAVKWGLSAGEGALQEQNYHVWSDKTFTLTATYIYNGETFTSSVTQQIVQKQYTLSIIRQPNNGHSAYTATCDVPGFDSNNIKWTLKAENTQAQGWLNDGYYWVDEYGTGSYYTVYASYTYNGKTITSEYKVTGIKNNEVNLDEVTVSIGTPVFTPAIIPGDILDSVKITP